MVHPATLQRGVFLSCPLEPTVWGPGAEDKLTILSQCMCNMGLLAVPLYLQAYSYLSSPLTSWEVTFLPVVMTAPRWCPGYSGWSPWAWSTVLTYRRKLSSGSASRTGSRVLCVRLACGGTAATPTTSLSGWWVEVVVW